MKKPLLAFERHRITYINDLMERIHDLSDSIYEDLMDGEFKSARQNVSELMMILEDVEDSLGDEVSEPR